MEKVDHKASTTSSLHITSTISAPNVQSLIQSVATILHTQLLEDMAMGKKIPEDPDLFCFSEEKYIKEKPEEFDELRKAMLRETPTMENIYEFMKALYDCAKFSPECCIICLVYINRMIGFTNMPLHPTNWRPLVLCSLVISQKVWDDKYLSNADFAFIYPFFKNEEINKLETKFLEILQYNVVVKASLYAKYYFELRSLYKNESEFPMKPLDAYEAQKLESRSSTVQQSEMEKAQKMSLTYNEKVPTSRARAVLS
jgi:hypothetical protein